MFSIAGASVSLQVKANRPRNFFEARLTRRCASESESIDESGRAKRVANERSEMRVIGCRRHGDPWMVAA